MGKELLKDEIKNKEFVHNMLLVMSIIGGLLVGGALSNLMLKYITYHYGANVARENEGQAQYICARRGVFGQQIGLLAVLCILGTGTWAVPTADPCGAKIISKVDKYKDNTFQFDMCDIIDCYGGH